MRKGVSIWPEEFERERSETKQIRIDFRSAIRPAHTNVVTQHVSRRLVIKMTTFVAKNPYGRTGRFTKQSETRQRMTMTPDGTVATKTTLHAGTVMTKEGDKKKTGRTSG